MIPIPAPHPLKNADLETMAIGSSSWAWQLNMRGFAIQSASILQHSFLAL
jgi:hypothetical protein